MADIKDWINVGSRHIGNSGPDSRRAVPRDINSMRRTIRMLVHTSGTSV